MAVLVPFHLIDLVLRCVDVRRDELFDFGDALVGGHRESLARAAGGESQGGDSGHRCDFHKSGHHVRMFLYILSQKRAEGLELLP